MPWLSLAKKTVTLQTFKTTTIISDSLTIKIPPGKWNLMALEAKYEGYPCVGTAWFEPVQKSGVWGSVTAVGLCKNSVFGSAENLLWHGKLPLTELDARVIVGLRDGQIAVQFSVSILLEEK